MSRTTKIFQINGRLFVADNIGEAIRLFQDEYPFPNEVEEVQLIKGRDGSPLAYIEDAEANADLSGGYNFDQCQDPNYIESLTIADEPIPVCKETPLDYTLEVYDAKTIKVDGKDIT